MGLLAFLIVGLIAGFVARAIVPGKDPMGILGTLVLGVVGSYVGGMIFSLFSAQRNFTDFTTTGLIGSIIGAVVALLIWRKVKARA